MHVTEANCLGMGERTIARSDAVLGPSASAASES